MPQNPEGLRPVLISYEPGEDGPIMEATIPRRPGWKLRATLAAEGGTYVIADLCVVPHDGPRPEGGVTSLLLRDIPLGQLPNLLSQRGSGSRPMVGDLVETVHGPGAVEALDNSLRPGRRGRGDRFYAEWAALYVARCEAGSTSPVKDLATEHHYSPATVRDIVRRSRLRGMFKGQSPPKGRAGGQLSDKALELLNEEDDQ